jgi:hypothetical protein
VHGLSWVMHDIVVDLFACWWTSCSTQSVVVWKMVPSCLLWHLWRERNDRSFENRERKLAAVESFFFFILYTWTAAFMAPLMLSFYNFFCSFFSS